MSVGRITQGKVWERTQVGSQNYACSTSLSSYCQLHFELVLPVCVELVLPVTFCIELVLPVAF